MQCEGSVARKGPSAWHAAMRTQREPSSWNSRSSATSLPVRTSSGIAAATFERERESARCISDSYRERALYWLQRERCIWLPSLAWLIVF